MVKYLWYFLQLLDMSKKRHDNNGKSVFTESGI